MQSGPIIFHIDVNSAFLSWTALQRLQQGESVDLRTIPSAIGGDMSTRHGVILAKSIPAKPYHVQTGEPIVNALKKCPQLVIAPPDMSFYLKKSEELMQFLLDICPIIEQVSIDECYLDYSYIASDYSSPTEAATLIKDRIYEEFGFTVNIGISDRKVLAKMASDFKKPNLVHTLYHREIQEKMWTLPVSDLYMCGKSSSQVLNKLEILTIGDLARADCEILRYHLKSHGQLLWEYANGIDDSIVFPIVEKAKGIGSSTTLATDIITREDALPVLLKLADQVSRSMRKEELMSNCLTVEIKYSSFQSITHQTITDTPIASCDSLYQVAVTLFDEMWNHSPIRLLGIRVTKLSSGDVPVQLNLFDYVAQKSPQKIEQKRQHLDAALDTIRLKYGDNSVIRASLLADVSTSAKDSDSYTDSSNVTNLKDSQ